MIEDKDPENLVEEDTSNLPEVTSEDIVNKLINVSSEDELKELTNLFNLNITKKEMIRVLQQDALLDIILKQAKNRLELRPDELSTKDLLEYLQIFQTNVGKSHDIVDKVNNAPTIQINANKNVVLNVGGLDRDSSENVIDFIKDVLKNIEEQPKESLNDLIESVKTVDGSDSDD